MKTKIFKNIDEVKALIKTTNDDGEYIGKHIDFEDCCDVVFECDVELEDVSLIIHGNVRGETIKVRYLKANNVVVKYLEVYHNIEARHIEAGDIWVNNNIKADDIKALKIKANHIDYYALCVAYYEITCKSIEGRRENSKHFCLDREIIINE